MIETVLLNDYQEIIDVWEQSIRATHHFLEEQDIQYFKPLILNEYLRAMELFCVRQENKIVGFIGLSADKIEMLFIRPEYFGEGIGKELINFAIHERKIGKVDVNEQNSQAVGFYRHMGFEILSRSPIDSFGKPFPILTMFYVENR
ncbi:MAG: GNAT family N-acetyltransferase [Planctomycetaceae bacterium]|jgi:putative acetyltransferase|nr:GNAT family N-acetyltransferase [Planctomycetaceae bacterium]